MKHTRIQQTDDALASMAARNQARAEIVKRVMGTKYLCHPVNRVQRKDAIGGLRPGAMFQL